MRTTLTLDDDVAVVLERVRKQRDASMSSRPKRREPVRTRSVALGRLRIAGIDNIAEALSIAEGETSK